MFLSENVWRIWPKNVLCSLPFQRDKQESIMKYQRSEWLEYLVFFTCIEKIVSVVLNYLRNLYVTLTIQIDFYSYRHERLNITYWMIHKSEYLKFYLLLWIVESCKNGKSDKRKSLKFSFASRNSITLFCRSIMKYRCRNIMALCWVLWPNFEYKLLQR